MIKWSLSKVLMISFVYVDESVSVHISTKTNVMLWVYMCIILCIICFCETCV